MEATKIKMNMDGTIRAKVLQYKSDGNTLTENWHTLTKLAEGIYLSYAAPDGYGQVYATVVFAKNGVFWGVGVEPEQYFSPEHPNYVRNMGMLGKMRKEYETCIFQAAEKGEYVRLLEIEVMRRLGHDVTPLYASREAYLKNRKEKERKRAEEAERHEREHNGEKYLCFHVSDYNGDIKGRIRDLMEQKHIAEYGTPSNGLITIWDAEEVEYWNRNVAPIEPPQSPVHLKFCIL